MTRQLKRLTINKRRLDDEPHERDCIRWLNKYTLSNTQTNIDSLKDGILCMDKYNKKDTHI